MKYKILAWIFVICGVLAIFGMIYDLFHRKMIINPNFLLLPIGIGLLNKSPWAHTAAYFSLWIFFLLSTLGILLCFVGKAYVSGLPANPSSSVRLLFALFFVGLSIFLWIVQRWIGNSKDEYLA